MVHSVPRWYSRRHMSGASAKYKKTIDNMFAQYAELFDEFAHIHTQYEKNPKKWQEKFNQVGVDVMDIMRDFERKLCHGMEKGQYASYSAKLADQYWAEIRIHFPLIDQVGVVIE